MPVGLVCPRCSVATTFHRAPVTACPSCQALFPDELRLSAEANLARQRAVRPTLLTIGIYGSGLVGGLTLFLMSLAPFNIGSFSIDGQAVTGPEFLRSAGVVFVTAGALCVAISYGLWKERPWTRELMMLFWVVIDAFLIVEAIMNPNADPGLIGTCFYAAAYVVGAGWYLYFRKGVVEYYAALRMTEQARTAISPRGA